MLEAYCDIWNLDGSHNGLNSLYPSCSDFHKLDWMKSCWSVSTVLVAAFQPCHHLHTVPILPDVLLPCWELNSYSSFERRSRIGVHLGNSVDQYCFPEPLCLIGSWTTVSEWCRSRLVLFSRVRNEDSLGKLLILPWNLLKFLRSKRM